MVVVADNKSSEPDEVRELTTAAGAEYLPMASNRGYGSAINSAVESLPPNIEWVLVSNPDLVLGTGSIDSLVGAGDSDENIAAVGPATLTDDGDVYPSARAIPSLRTGVGHAIFANIWPHNPWSRAYKQGSATDWNRRDAGWLSGACVLVRRSAFDRVGGFDADYFMYFEDVDLGYRLGKAGFRNVYEPAAVVTHTGAHSTTEDSARMVAAHHASARLFLNRKYSGWYLWPVRAGLSVGLSLRSAVQRRGLEH